MVLPSGIAPLFFVVRRVGGTGRVGRPEDRGEPSRGAGLSGLTH
jgi:hypothetical protein